MIAASWRPRASVLLAAILLGLFSLTFLAFQQDIPRTVSSSFRKGKAQSNHEVAIVAPPNDTALHILLPASNGDVNLCKTILTGKALGYPTPTIVAWNEEFHEDHLLGRGSHIAKISRVLEWLDNSPDVKGDELVLMMDAYDIWFQLRKEVFISRYHAINAAANERLRKRLGRAADVEDLKQTIVFGAGKRCAPNQVHTVACYPIPESPLPEDLYGANTDTIMGRNKYTSLRQRYLNSGYIIGPKSDMRKMFARAWDKVQATTDHMDFDNGSGGSDFMYHGSDQSIFNDMLGEQEFQREVMRRRHLSLADKARGRGKAPKQTYIEGTLVDDPLNPSFHHQVMEHKDGRPDEFSMGLDYFSELGQQTVNAEDDARYITYGGDIEEQTSNNRHAFDCPSRVTGVLPADILNGSPMLDDQPAEWRDQPLYTNMCLNVIPAMMHHNGDKNAREYAWQGMWVQPHARNAVANMEGTPAAHIAGGADISWGELCPADFDGEIFRDV